MKKANFDRFFGKLLQLVFSKGVGSGVEYSLLFLKVVEEWISLFFSQKSWSWISLRKKGVTNTLCIVNFYITI